MRTAARCTGCLLIVALAGGCSSAPDPVIEPSAVRVESADAQGSQLMLTLDAENPGDRPLPLRRVTYRVIVGGREVFNGSRSPEATLSRYGARRIELPASTPGLLEAPPGTPWRVEGSMEYTPPGPLTRVLGEWGLARDSVGFSGSGVVGEGPR